MKNQILRAFSNDTLKAQYSHIIRHNSCPSCQNDITNLYNVLFERDEKEFVGIQFIEIKTRLEEELLRRLAEGVL